ncbi:Trp biosynthesis-associated membrane protein [Nocardioides sp. SYSU DS0651]|uniref:Trp biosynthesis-associated membrane protein n=1 Tax=Nocardioides sp. SYSU DS0651 TaxID=3415955 RepID=UPI003F4B7F13
MAEPPAARRTFGPVVLLGLAASGFGAVAGHRAMLRVSEEHLRAIGASAYTGDDFNRVEFPLAGALALVALACWGVLLVTRGLFRRVVAVLAAVAAAGMLAVVAVGGFVQHEDAAADLAARIGLGGGAVPVERTVWFWVALAASLLAVAAAAAAIRFTPGWPEMGTRYDAPTGGAVTDREAAAGADQEPEEQSNLDLWKSLDEGTDPTERRRPRIEPDPPA